MEREGRKVFFFMIFDLRVKKYIKRKYSWYKFTFMLLIDKKITNKKKIHMKKIEVPKLYRKGQKKAKEGNL